jgi:hypothetical protein
MQMESYRDAISERSRSTFGVISERRYSPVFVPMIVLLMRFALYIGMKHEAATTSMRLSTELYCDTTIASRVRDVGGQTYLIGTMDREEVGYYPLNAWA